MYKTFESPEKLENTMKKCLDLNKILTTIIKSFWTFLKGENKASLTLRWQSEVAPSSGSNQQLIIFHRD